jgi:hypothetical protein
MASGLGNGRSLLFTFDLFGQATASGLQSEFSHALIDAIEYVHPGVIVPMQGGLVPLDLVVTNAGVGVHARVMVEAPTGARFEAEPGDVVAGQVLEIERDLEPNQTATFTRWLRLPMTGTEATVKVSVQYLQDGQYVDIESTTLVIPVR